ncbi:AzlC family ABC transporter permease [Demequina lignilytica]|uniref:AzlC family ABC transporter permease n=1 Tax=Demequina lignilytica TaxID=3051663 RepID=A0AAW7MA41_9MICO|nr:MULTISPECIES: AzlC family ABC transporter permease [unclassified Demequina]MDN4478623.1 AzlC family ABC transporter permease [Demequina sp. SYSU T00039-1]MDN4483817.1 AzlC family ABC transporter permease [Demequina sp. SYSU T0a273]MDN4488601.1 AzlC family ABC transporter permease [Demequina sp. SYSU T00039]
MTASASAAEIPSARRDFWAGARAVATLMPGAVLFGLAFGALVRVVGIDPVTGFMGSVMVQAGASQIAILEALRANAPAVIAVITAVVINARFALWSAAMAPIFAPFPTRWKLWLSYLMTDQSAVITLQHHERYPDPVRRRRFVHGAESTFVGVWLIGTAAGVTLGPVIPDAWQIGFIVPLMFISVLVPGLHGAPALVAVAVAAVTVVVAKDLPYGLNVLLGSLAGIAAGAFVPDRRRPDPHHPDDGLAHDAAAGE